MSVVDRKQEIFSRKEEKWGKKTEKKDEACASLCLRGGDGGAEEAPLEGRLVLQ